MRYEDRDELVKGLRDLADFIDKKGVELPIEYVSPMELREYFWGDAEKCKANMIQAAKLLGKSTKDYTSYSFSLEKNFGKFVKLVFNTEREKVCVKKVVGIEQVPKKVYVEIPNETVDKEIIEWDCQEPLLKG